MNLALVIFLGGAVVIAWIYFWSRQRPEVNEAIDLDTMVGRLPGASQHDAILVSKEHGRLVYVNGQARHMLKMNGGQPHLEHVAELANPSHSFLELFAGEGQASFQIGKRWVEASSHRIPTGTEMRTVVVMRELAGNTSNPDVLDMGRAMSIINEIGETVNVTLGVEPTLQAVLNIIHGVVPFDAGEICLWSDSEKALFQRGWVGDSAYLLSLMEAGGRYSLEEGITGWIAQYRRPVLLGDATQFIGIRPKLEDNPYQSFVGVPVMLGETFMGTLELASLQENAFAPGDMSLLQAISKSIAVTIYNTEIYTDQVQRITAIANLQQSVDISRAQTEGVETVYAALNERIASLMNADMCGILLNDADRGGLVIQLPVYGLPEALVRTVFIPLVKDSPQFDIWQKQPYWISNDVIDEPLVEALGLHPVVSLSGITNTAWIPLEVGGERIGVVAVSNKQSEGGFTSNDIQNLSVLAAQASIVIENVRLYERGKRMDTELVGLQEITNAIGALSHETEFFNEITERIANLMEIEKVGILIYEENAKRLAARLPFYGVEDDMVRDYAIALPDDSVMRELWEEERYWYSNRVLADTLVFEAGLDRIAEKIGIEKTMIAVLQASGQRLGAVQISNKRNGEDFNDGDARLLMIFATQTAAIIQNARLYREAQRSADQAQGLRRIAELAGNVLTTQETFTPVLAEIADLLEVEQVFINVLDQQKGSLVTYPRWVFGADLSEPIIQDIYSPGFEHSVAISQRPFITNDLGGESRILPGYQEIADRMKLENGLMVPLVFGDRTLGELGIANRRTKPFSKDDLEIMKVIAAQTSAALDRLLLYEATGENLNRRMKELDATSRVSNELTVTLELDQVLLVIREETIHATDAADCTIALLEPKSTWPSADIPRLQRRLGYEDQMLYLADIELEAILRASETVLITDYEFSTMNPQPENMRSALAVPINYLDNVVGVIHLFHHEANQFDERASAFAMTMAVKASLGFGNWIRYREQMERSDRLRRRVEQLNRIFELGHLFQTNTDPVSILDAIAYSVQQSVGFDTIVMLLADQDTDVLHRVAHAGLPLDVFNESRVYTISQDALNDLFRPEYQISESYFFPIEDVDKWHTGSLKALNTAYEGNRTVDMTGQDGWRDGDKFLVRLQGPSGNIVGLMVMDRPHNNMRPDRGTIEVLEIFANQAASTIENTRLYLTSVNSAEQEARLNEMMEAVASTLDIEEIVRAVAQGALRMVAFTRMTVVLQADDASGFQVLNVGINRDSSLSIRQAFQQALGNTAINRTYLEGRDYLYFAGQQAPQTFEDLQNWQDAGERTTLILPLLTGGNTIGVIHLGSDLEQAYGFNEFRSLLRRMAQLVASAVQNARLFDQAVNLRVLNESVLESIQQGIVVLDDAGQIISFNAFMSDHFGWQRDGIGQNLFAYRPGLADLIQTEIADVLTDGKPRESLSQDVLLDDDHLVVGNFYMYPLRSQSEVRGAVILVEDVTDSEELKKAVEARANQLSALTDVSSRITSSLERDEVVQLALEEMGWLIPHQGMTLWRRNGSYMVLEGMTGLTVDAARDLDLRFLFSDFNQIYQVVDSQRVVVEDGISSLPDGLTCHENASSWMGVPLVNQGHVVGLMMLTDSESSTYLSKSDQNIAFAFASQVAIALANADLFEQTFDRTNELGTLLEAAQATSLTTDLDTVLRTVVELMFSALEMDICSIMLWDEVDNRLEVQLDVTRHGELDTTIGKGTVLQLDDFPAKLRALRDRDVIVISTEDPNRAFPEEIEEIEALDVVARMLVPLVVSDTSRGLIQLGTRSREGITQQKVRLARALGSQVAVAIENARLSAETIAHFEESLIINDLSRAISSTLDVDDMFRVVRDQLPNVTGASELYVALYEPETEEITFPYAVSNGQEVSMEPRKLASDEVSFIIKQRRPLNLGADYYSPEELRRSLGIVDGDDDAKSYLGVPMIAGDEVLGVLAVRDTERTRAFTINEQRILTTVGSQLGAAIQNARLFRQISSFADDLEKEVTERTRELEDERDRIDTLYQITSELARTLDMDRLMPRALGMVAKAVTADDGVIMQLDPITDQLYSRAVLNPNSLQHIPENEHPFHPAENIARHIILEDEHVLMINELHDEDYWDTENSAMQPWHSALAVLLETNEELLGVMVVMSKRPSAFHESHLRLMVAAANQVASSINNAELYKMIREQAERLGTLLRAEQEEADKNKAILEGIADGVVLADSAGNVILFNTAAERILRVPRTDVVSRPFSEVTAMYGGAANQWSQALENYMVAKENTEMGDFLDERVALGDRTVSVQLSPVYTGEKFLGTVSVFRDITREVEAERSKSEFVANVSHEFRTPLTSIKGYNDLLLMGAFGVLEDKQREMLETVKDNVSRLTTLVEDVLNISKIDSGKDHLTVEAYDVNELVSSVLQTLRARPQHQGKDLKVTFEPAETPLEIEVDHEKIVQAIGNVIDNAFNYTLGGGSVDVNITPDDEQQRVVVTVTDSGVGIPEEFRDKIWRRFERHQDTAITLDVFGTGLGLPIVKELVEMHGGSVTFESEVGKGSTFYIALPYRQPDYISRVSE